MCMQLTVDGSAKLSLEGIQQAVATVDANYQLQPVQAGPECEGGSSSG